MFVRPISRISAAALLLGMFALQSHAAIPLQINHQGFIDVGGTAFNGNGDFRFALVDPDSGNNVWTNDASGIGTSATPTAAVSLPVINGIYNVRLGDTTIPNMTAITSALFNDDNLELRVWFDDGTNGVEVLSPDQPLTSAPYTFHAAVADDADTVDGMEGAALEESAEILAASASHNSDTNAHSNIQFDGARITSGKIANVRLNTGDGNALDADTVDGAHAAALEESTEIDTDISTHNTDTGAHATIQLNGSNITTGTIANARLNTGSGNGLDADTVDGIHASGLVGSNSLPFNLLENGSVERWPAGPSADPDKWTNTGNVIVTRESSKVKHATYSVKLFSSQDTYLFQIASTDTDFIRNNEFTFACWVFCGAPNLARIAIDDGISVTNSAFHSGTPGWERLSVTVTASSSATKLEARMVLTFTTTGFFDAAILMVGSAAYDFTPHHLDETDITVDEAADLVDGGVTTLHSHPTLTGEVRMWAGQISSIPSGWLLCDGSAVSRTTYADLFGVIGTIYGNGDGSTTFNIPDFRDSSPMGATQDDAGVPKTNVSGSLTQSGGAATHTLIEDEIPAHQHQETYVDASGNIQLADTRNLPQSRSSNGVGPSAPFTTQDGPSPPLNTVSTGGGQPHNNLHPYFAIVFIIQT